MNKIYYGGGNCSIKGEDDIISLQIHYSGAVKIKDKTPPQFHIVAGNDIILIFSFGSSHELTDLFDYVGKFKINKIIAGNRDLEKVTCISKKVMDYSEMINTKAEDLDTKSEKLSAGYAHKGIVSKTTVDKSIIEDLFSEGEFYTKGGKAYHGSYHAHLKSGAIMSGANHSKSSKILYEKSAKTDKLIKTGNN